jgi:flagellar FliL protein
MADIPTLEPAPHDAATAGAAPPRKRSWLVITLAVSTALAGAAGVGSWLMLGHSKPKSGDKARADAVPRGPVLYIGLDPPFVTNFEAEQLVRFLQITVQLMSHDAATIELVKANDPAIRNDLLLLFGNQKYADIATRAGKEKLRADALATVRRIIGAAGGQPDRLEAVYFTSFVMQ